MINTLNIDKRLWKTKARKMTEYTDTGTFERAFTVKCWRQKPDRKGVKEQGIRKKRLHRECSGFRCLRVKGKKYGNKSRSQKGREILLT